MRSILIKIEQVCERISNLAQLRRRQPALKKGLLAAYLETEQIFMDAIKPLRAAHVVADQKQGSGGMTHAAKRSG